MGTRSKRRATRYQIEEWRAARGRMLWRDYVHAVRWQMLEVGAALVWFMLVPITGVVYADGGPASTPPMFIPEMIVFLPLFATIIISATRTALVEPYRHRPWFDFEAGRSKYGIYACVFAVTEFVLQGAADWAAFDHIVWAASFCIVIAVSRLINEAGARRAPRVERDAHSRNDAAA